MGSSSGRKLGQLGQVRWLALALTLATVVLAACGDGDGDRNGGATAPGVDDGVSGEGSQEIVIETRVNFEQDVTGEVLEGSFIGDSPFCPGGTFSDQEGNDEIGLVDRTFECPDGTLRIGITPGVGQDGTQTGPWQVVSGTGAYEGVEGDGQWRVTLDPGDDTKGRETFTGTVSP
jgi:hypothetical protein